MFGSNLAGRHGAGAAKFAREWRGAQPGVGEGITGCSYAIPTKDADLKTLPLDTIKQSVQRFIEYARQHESDIFQITRLGCGLAGLSDEQMAPMFGDVPKNCALPGVWIARWDPSLMRVIIAGGRDYADADTLRSILDRAYQKWKDKNLMVITGGARGADTLAETWAVSKGIHTRRFEADWGRYGKLAGPFRNSAMAWFANYLVAFPGHNGTQNMITIAKAGGLQTYVINGTKAPGRP